MDSFPDLYPLTSLQIGDVKSSLSQAFLYFAPTSRKFLILVDNQSWQKNNHSTSACIKELMNTKYRMSPFRNNKSVLRSQSSGDRSSSHESKNFDKWLPDISMASLREKAPFSMMNLYEALHGFIVFDVLWEDVCSINYLNELQRDASFALEVKAWKKWEFNSIVQALSCITTWFSGTYSETQTLQSNLVLLHDKVPSHSSDTITVSSKELLLDDASQAELFSEDVFFDVREHLVDTNDMLHMDHQVEESTSSEIEETIENDSNFESMEYSDTFLLFRFSDRNLPFKLQQIITSDLKLLAMLEAGLPSWVIFLQSYPLFCKVYSPWMTPLLRTCYLFISIITVMIGFYDLYKHVPLLKTTASHLCGPLFRWIEAWDMISRIRYLGTMLFLQNLEKGIKWFLGMIRVMKLPVLLLMKPLIRPLEEIIVFVTPMWSILAEMGEQFYSSAWVLVETLCSTVLDFVEILLSPLELLCSYLLSLVNLICPLLHSMWELFLSPTTRGCLIVANYVVYLFSCIYKVLQRFVFTTASSTSHIKYLTQVKPDPSHISLWHSLRHDIYSKVFKSLRNIIHGLVTCFTSCNRHRHSIYNHLRAILCSIYSHLKAMLWWLCYTLRLASPSCPCCQVPQVEIHLKAGVQVCELCKEE